MSARRIGRFVVVVMGRAGPSDADWNQLLVWYRPKAPERVLIYTEGGVPNAAQRAALREGSQFTSEHRGAGVSTSRVAQAVGTAVSWFIRTLKTFGPNEMHHALDHLEATPSERPLLLKAVDEMRRERASYEKA